MANMVFANGREVSCKKADGKSICEFPDVCFTPPETPATPPGVPIPYPNTALATDTTSGTKTVEISGAEVMMKNQSFFKKSTGDEAGCAAKKGVITSTIQGKAYFISWSMDVKVEGENVVRHLDMTTHNHASPMANGAAPAAYTDAAATSGTGKKKDPCRHDKKKKKGQRYVVYIAEDLDNPGHWYVGRTSGAANMTTDAILKKRKSTHHREGIGNLIPVCETDSYSAVRGAEQKHQEAVSAGGMGVKQINGIGPRNKKKQDYIDCAKQKNEKTCSICGN